MKKKIIITLGVLFAITMIGMAIFRYYVKPKYVAPLIVAIEQFLEEDEEIVAALIEEYEKSLQREETQQVIENATQVVAQQGTEGKTEEATNKQQGSAQQGKTENKTENINSVPKNMKELQKQVEPSDLKVGLTIANKLDTGYLMGLAKGGVTQKKKEEVRAYLLTSLTQVEYGQLKYLVGKYAHLLK